MRLRDTQHTFTANKIYANMHVKNWDTGRCSSLNEQGTWDMQGGVEPSQRRKGLFLLVLDTCRSYHLSDTECWKIPQKYISLDFCYLFCYICTTSFTMDSKILSRLSVLAVVVWAVLWAHYLTTCFTNFSISRKSLAVWYILCLSLELCKFCELQ